MYICLHCGHEFEKPNTTHNGGYWEEEWNECPNCGSEDFEEAAECVECGAVKSVDYLVNGWCEDCLNIAAEDYKTVFEYGADRTQVVELNGVLAREYSRTEIEAILLNHLMNNGNLKKATKDFAFDDKPDFAEWMNDRD